MDASVSQPLPPQSYLMLDNALHRAMLPLSSGNLQFLRQRGINTFLNLTDSPLDEHIQEFAESNDICVLSTNRIEDGSAKTDEARDSLAAMSAAPTTSSASATSGAGTSSDIGTCSSSNAALVNADSNDSSGGGGGNDSALPQATAPVPAGASSAGSSSVMDNASIENSAVEGKGNKEVADRDTADNAKGDISASPSVREEVHQTILSDLRRTDEWVIDTLSTLIQLSVDSNVLLICDWVVGLDAVVLACLRRVQRWGMAAVLSEFRFIAGGDLFDLEQFIEVIDLSVCESILAHGAAATNSQPAFIRAYSTGLAEEERMKAGLCRLDEEKRALYMRVIFHDSHNAVSEEVKYSPLLSLIDDKDDDVD